MKPVGVGKEREMRKEEGVMLDVALSVSFEIGLHQGAIGQGGKSSEVIIGLTLSALGCKLCIGFSI